MCKTMTWPNGLIEKPIAEEDVIALLALEDPLKEIGLKWWFYTLGNKVDFHGFYKAHKDEKS